MVDWKVLKTNIWVGIVASSMQMVIDSQFISLKLYEIKNPIIDVFGSSLFFLIGPVFVVGVLFSQYHPVKKWAIILYVPVISAMFSIVEYFVVKRNVLVYLNWNQLDSIAINMVVVSSLSWVCIVILGKRGNEHS